MAKGTDSFMGKAMPLVGNVEFISETAADDAITITGAASQSGDLLVFATDGGTELMYIEDDGVTNWTIAKTAADNAVALTLTNAGTFTTGYHQGMYVSQTATGKYTTGSSQINSMAVDLALGGEIGCEAEGLYVYVMMTGTLSLTSANISGAVLYIAPLGTSQPSSRCGLQIHIQGATQASAQDAFIICRTEDTGQVTSALHFQATNNPTYLLYCNNENGMVSTQVPNGNVIKTISVNLNGTEYWIPLYSASTS